MCVRKMLSSRLQQFCPRYHWGCIFNAACLQCFYESICHSAFMSTHIGVEGNCYSHGTKNTSYWKSSCLKNLSGKYIKFDFAQSCPWLTHMVFQNRTAWPWAKNLRVEQGRGWGWGGGERGGCRDKLWVRVRTNVVVEKYCRRQSALVTECRWKLGFTL